jgi:hypothetical protein
VRVVYALSILLLGGCASTTGYEDAKVEAEGISIRLTSINAGRATLLLQNISSTPIAYDHWMTRGPEAVPYCRDDSGEVRICSSRVYVTEDGDPMTHESYLPSGKRVSFHAIPSKGEQVGVRLWISGRGRYVWLSTALPNISLQADRER